MISEDRTYKSILFPQDCLEWTFLLLHSILREKKHLNLSWEKEEQSHEETSGWGSTRQSEFSQTKYEAHKKEMSLQLIHCSVLCSWVSPVEALYMQEGKLPLMCPFWIPEHGIVGHHDSFYTTQCRIAGHAIIIAKDLDLILFQHL